MKIIINIPEEVYNGIKSRGNFISDFNLVNAFKNAITLPKHGRLIDADALMRDYGNDDVKTLLDISPTILEADKE